MWEGKAAVSLDDWIAEELERAPEPTPEQLGSLKAIFDSASIPQDVSP
ncbi:hypothetical protein STRIP9103_05137 [Streptomyces ipomoeae 91-03]|uniref:Uncharacterized protein n=1 Tax=Streptomyces ipomoeae 91-03 TaxID=698759 RepID=L1KSH1_9ACTN|nr:hypothetical protein STRIP9103_05137 [Streptomyces ipomoeae 91-03]